ncbi:MAG: ATP synthase F1 subunit delta [Planctomycetota bacterium]
MIVDPVTNRWADALFAVAKSAGAVDEIQHDTARLSEEVSSPAVAAFLFGSSISQEAREQKFAPLLEQLHPKTQSFVRLLFAKRRQEVMRGIGDAFKRKVYDETGRIEGVVESARALDSEDVSRLETAVGARIGKTVVLSQRTDDSLVGGARVIVGARLFDATVKGRLDAMRERLMSSGLPA